MRTFRIGKPIIGSSTPVKYFVKRHERKIIPTFPYNTMYDNTIVLNSMCRHVDKKIILDNDME